MQLALLEQVTICLRVEPLVLVIDDDEAPTEQRRSEAQGRSLHVINAPLAPRPRQR